MNIEVPYYLPCKAAHTPKRLENSAAELIADMIISGSVPQEIKKSSMKSITNFRHLCCLQLDKIILGAVECVEQHEMLKNQFKKMKSWWEDDTWFGSVESPLRTLIQESISQLLEQMDYYSHCPLFRFTCQLCYTKRSGIFDHNSVDIVIKIPKIRCNTFASFLKFLGPFQVEQLLNVYMIFGNPDPIVVIVKNAPRLRSVSMRYNSCDYVISNIGKNCPNIERFVLGSFIGDITVSEHYLYKAFFKGKSKEQVVKGDCDSRDISFPKLSELDVGHGGMCRQFLYYINFYYPCIKSLSCNSINHNASYLLFSCDISENFKPFQVVDICLSSYCLISLSESNFFQYFPNIKHTSVLLNNVKKSEFDILKEKLTKVLTTFPHSISIYLPFESISDEELKNIFIPLFTEIGKDINALQFHIMREIKVQVIWELINHCPYLELLSLYFVCDLLYNCVLSDVMLSPLPYLKSLSYIVLDSYSYDTDVNSFVNFMLPLEDLLRKASNIFNFELVIPSMAREWIVNAIAKNYVPNVKTFILKLQTYDDTVDVDFYAVVIEAMTSLKRLILIGLSPSILSNLRHVFRTAQLSIVPGKHVSYIAYNGIYSKYSLSDTSGA